MWGNRYNDKTDDMCKISRTSSEDKIRKQYIKGGKQEWLRKIGENID